MNDSQLDSLLSQQDRLEGEKFTEQVLTTLPKPITQKQRSLILIGSTLTGGILTFALLPSGGYFSRLFSGSFSGEPAALAITIALLLGVGLFSFGLAAAVDDEI